MLHRTTSSPTDGGRTKVSENQDSHNGKNNKAAPGVDFESFGLAEPLLRALSKNGFHTPTIIQTKSIPVALQGRDVMASAQTGTGKTAAFVLPALQRLLTPAIREGRGPRVLILTPTRELAGQVEAVIAQLGRFTKLRSGIVVGGVSYGPQERMLRAGVELLVATPGRLMDHMTRGLMDFTRLELFVLDEADRMLDMGFIKPVQRIAAALPEERQTLLFSATLEGEVLKITKRLLNDPERIHLSPVKQRNQAISQHLHAVNSPEHKHALLSHFLTDPKVNQAIVFTATKRGADRLTKRLKASGMACAALHGNMRQNARQKTVDSLRRGDLRVLVATDVAARGIDVEGVSHVINFDLPTVPEDYIHRIGRTGRNGNTGTAISLVGAEDRVKLSRIERITGHRIERLNITELRVVDALALNSHRAKQYRDPKQSGDSKQSASPQGNNGARRDNGPQGNSYPQGNAAPQEGVRGETSTRNPARTPGKPYRPRNKRRRNPANGSHGNSHEGSHSSSHSVPQKASNNRSRSQKAGTFTKKRQTASAR